MTTPLDVKVSAADAEVLRQYQRDVGQTVRDAEIRITNLEAQLAEVRAERDDARGLLRIAERERDQYQVETKTAEWRIADLDSQLADLKAEYSDYRTAVQQAAFCR